MSKLPEERKDSTTDFFLKFISRQRNNEHKTKNEKNNEKKDHSVINLTYSSMGKIINAINSLLDRILTNSLAVKIFSLILAVMLVLTVNGGSLNSIFSTPNSGEYLTKVPVNVIGLQGDYSVSGMPSTVSVAVIGPSLSIYSTKLTNNYYVSVDLSSYGTGNHTVELKPQNFAGDLKVTVVPQTVSINISTKVTKTFKLGYKFINKNSLDSKLSVSVDSMSQSKVEVTGTQENIDKIVSVKAAINLSGVTQSFEQSSKIYAYDRSGKKVNVEITPSKVNVECTVSSYSKEVPINVEYTGATASGYGVKSVTLSQDKVRIYGSKSKLKSIEAVTVKVNVSDMSDDAVLKDLKLTSNSSIYKMSVSRVDASVDIEPAITKTFIGVPINIINNSLNYTVSFKTNEDKVNVVVTGVQSVLDALTNDDLTAYIDMSGLKPGKNTVTVNITGTNGSLQYAIVGNNQIEITVKE